ncbi:MAG TPA: replicative DNA helicase [Anaerolineales bacterium]|nr:replicative DNA helicase [Anaerolineales bacterium]
MSDQPYSSPEPAPPGDGRGAPALPHNREAEEAVLGSVLLHPEAYFEIAPILTSDAFFLYRNRWIWDAFSSLQEQRLPIDILTTSEELDRQGRLSETGGPAYLTALINNVPSTLNVVAYARLVEEMATRRRLLGAANEIAKLAYAADTPVEEVVNDAEKAVFGVSERRLTHQLSPIRHVLSEFYDRIDYLARHRDETIGVPTGFIDLDRLLGGMQPSDLLIIAGRPGQGKSGFCLSVAKNAAQLHKKHVALFSLEMSNEQLVQRLLAQETAIDSQRLRLGDVHDQEWPLFTQAVSALSETQIYLDDTPALTPLQLHTKCRRLHMEIGLDLVIVDYLQLMTGDSASENRVQEVSSITRNLKVLARELKVPVLAAAQLSRAVEQRSDKHPLLSDLRESGSLEQDADVVLFIYRPDQYETDTLKPNVAEIIVAKHRNGPVGQVELVFRPTLAKFENAETRRVRLAEAEPEG